jgi:hypothetical protein
MSDTALATGTIYSPHSVGETRLAENNVQQIILLPPNLGRECMIASEGSLMSDGRIYKGAGRRGAFPLLRPISDKNGRHLFSWTCRAPLQFLRQSHPRVASPMP